LHWTEKGAFAEYCYVICQEETEEEIQKRSREIK
jgi:hypothetical protein